MDIEQIQKVNAMAQNLVNTGLASTMEEAMQIANNIQGSPIPQASGPAGATPVDSEYLQSGQILVNEAVQSSSSQSSPQQYAGFFPLMPQSQSIAPSAAFSQAGASPSTQEFKSSNEMATEIRVLNFRLNEQQHNIKQLQTQLHALHEKMNAAHAMQAQQNAARPIPHIISTSSVGGQTTLQTQQQTPQSQMAATIIDASTGRQIPVTADHSQSDSTGKKLHARVGGYTSEDVSVEKMFYCGGR